MRVTVFGAGAVGGHLAAKLGSVPDVAVSVVARGPHLAAIRSEGLRLIAAGREWHSHPAATDDPAQLPPQDLVFVTLKAPAIAASAPAIGRLLAPGGTAVFLNNGVQWWMEHRAAPGEGPPAAIMAAIGEGRFLAGIAYSANNVEAPGLVHHNGWDMWQVGEPDGGPSPRAETTAGLLRAAGLNGIAHPDIASAIWTKLVLNGSGNPLAALTRLDSQEIGHVEPLADLVMAVRGEIAAIAAAMGHDYGPESLLPESREQMRQSPGVQPSMLQDVLAGRPMEVDALIDGPRRVARACGVATPVLDVVSALLAGLDRAIANG